MPIEEMIKDFFPEFEIEHDRIYLINPDFSICRPSSGPLAGITLRALNLYSPSQNTSLVCVISHNSDNAYCSIAFDTGWNTISYISETRFMSHSFINNLKFDLIKIPGLLSSDLYLGDHWIKWERSGSDWELYSCSMEER